MKRKKTYAEKLRDPRWQKKRLEVLERDGWTCTSCLDSESTLHVHHACYERGVDPWDHDENTLWTLCESCHEDAQGAMTLAHYLLGLLPPDILWTACGQLLLVAEDMAPNPPGNEKVRRLLSDRCRTVRAGYEQAAANGLRRGR